MLWKKSLCKTWIVFILIKCICSIIKINHVWSRVKNIALKNIVFQTKPIVFPRNPLFSNMCTFLSHCFETKIYHWYAHIISVSKYTNVIAIMVTKKQLIIISKLGKIYLATRWQYWYKVLILSLKIDYNIPAFSYCY